MKSKKVKRVINKEWEKDEVWSSRRTDAIEKRKEELVKYFIDKFRSLFPGENPEDVICLLSGEPTKLILIDKSKINYVQPTEEGMKERIEKFNETKK